MALADHLVERAGPQPCGKWGALFQSIASRGNEQILGHRLNLGDG